MAHRGGYQGYSNHGRHSGHGGHHHNTDTGGPFGSFRSQQQGNALNSGRYASFLNGGMHDDGPFSGRHSHASPYGGQQQQRSSHGGRHTLNTGSSGAPQHDRSFSGGDSYGNQTYARFPQSNHQHGGDLGGHRPTSSGISIHHHQNHRQGEHQHGGHRGGHHPDQQRGYYSSQPIILRDLRDSLVPSLPYDEPDHEDPMTHIRARAVTTDGQTIDFPLPFRRAQLIYGSCMFANLDMDSTEPGIEIEDKVSSMVQTAWGPVHPMDYVLRWLHSFDPIPLPSNFQDSTQLNLGHLSDLNNFLDLARLWRACWRLDLNEPFKRQSELGQAIFDAVKGTRLSVDDVVSMYEILEGVQRHDHMIKLVAKCYVERLSEREMGWHEGVLRRFNGNAALRDGVIKPLLEQAADNFIR